MDQVIKWVPTSSAMAALGVTRQRIYQLIREGLLVAKQVNVTWLIAQHSIDARLADLRRENDGDE